MIKVVVQCDANKGMELVRELRSAGLVQGQDFDFEYHPYNYNNFTGEDVDRHMVFSFHTEKYSTFYALNGVNMWKNQFINEHTEAFQQKFEAYIGDSEKYKQYIRRMPYHEWDGRLPFNTDTEVVPMKCVHLTRDNLERLVRQEEFIERLENDAAYGKNLLTKIHADARIRDDNPAVAKAYEKYLMLLELARK